MIPRRQFMKVSIGILCCALLSGCTEEVTVVAIQENEECYGGKMTVMDNPIHGRFKRCGVWGSIGETFRFNPFNN